MSKHRVVKSDFWVDDYVEQLMMKERYLFLYLLTNPNTNILGIYQTTLKRMAFETGMEEDQIESILLKFKNDDKVHYINNYILLVNFQRHQSLNPTIKKGIQKLFDSLPKTVVDFILSKKSRIYDRLSTVYLIDYRYLSIDKDKNTSKDKNAKNSPLVDIDKFINEIPEYIYKYGHTKGQVFKTVDDLVNYCKAHGKKYKDYYAALSNFLKKIEPQKNLNNKLSFDEFKEEFKKANGNKVIFKEDLLNKITEKYPFIFEYDLESDKFKHTYHEYCKL